MPEENIGDRLTELYRQLGNLPHDYDDLDRLMEEIEAEFIRLQDASAEISAAELESVAAAWAEANKKLIAELKNLDEELRRNRQISQLAKYQEK